MQPNRGQGTNLQPKYVPLTGTEPDPSVHEPTLYHWATLARAYFRFFRLQKSLFFRYISGVYDLYLVHGGYDRLRHFKEFMVTKMGPSGSSELFFSWLNFHHDPQRAQGNGCCRRILLLKRSRGGLWSCVLYQHWKWKNQNTSIPAHSSYFRS